MDEKKETFADVPPGAAALVNPGVIGQIRQMSIPLAARIAAVALAVAVLVMGGFLVVDGWQHCAGACDGKNLESGTSILGASILPAVLIVYLAFAETGVKALTRKMSELLDKTIPTALHQEPLVGFAVAGEIGACKIDKHAAEGNPRARYRLIAQRGDETASMVLLVELNVSKVNLVFFIPVSEDADKTVIHHCFQESVAGAQHEGYSFDEGLSEVMVDGRRYFRLLARKRLPENFLWDPALKLHFAQDLRMFAYAVMIDGWPLLDKA